MMRLLLLIDRYALRLTALILFLLSGCHVETESDITAWMRDVRTHTKVQALPLNAPKEFIPFSYTANNNIDPFNVEKITSAINRQRSIGGINPDFNRRREALEAFPLDTVHMVGTISRTGKQFALVQVDNIVYQVQVGSYIGQNFGKIERITETVIELSELIPDATKVWERRKVRLELQENKQ